MHNNMHFSMVDGNFSLTHLMFFPYHSWIDVMLEMKIRQCDTPQQANNLYKKLNESKKVKQRFDPLLDDCEDRSCKTLG
jgi:hypothetical protein